METRLLSNYTCTYLREIQYYQGNIHGTQASRFKASTLTSQNSKKKKGIPNQSNFTPECCVILRSYFTLAMFAPAFNKTEMYALLLVKTNFSEKKKTKNKKTCTYKHGQTQVKTKNFSARFTSKTLCQDKSWTNLGNER